MCQRICPPQILCFLRTSFEIFLLLVKGGNGHQYARRFGRMFPNMHIIGDVFTSIREHNGSSFWLKKIEPFDILILTFRIEVTFHVVGEKKIVFKLKEEKESTYFGYLKTQFYFSFKQIKPYLSKKKKKSNLSKANRKRIKDLSFHVRYIDFFEWKDLTFWCNKLTIKKI